MAYIEIQDSSEIVPGKLIPLSYRGGSLVLLKQNGKIKAFQNSCPHQGTLLSGGYIEKDEIICPGHQWRFSCIDGRNKNSQHLREYPIVQQEGKFYVKIDEIEPNESTSATKNKSVADLPSPVGTPLLGHILQFKAENKHQVTEAWADEVGDLYTINFLGKKVLVVANPEMNEQILKMRPTHFRRFSKINEVMEEMGIEGVFNAEGERWNNHRKVVAESLNVKNVKSFFPIIYQKTVILRDRLRGNHNPIDIQQEMMRYTVDITTCIAFGYDTNTMEKGDDVIQNHLEKIFPMVNKRVTAPIPIWRLLKSKDDRELDNALKEIKNTVKAFIENARERLAKNPALKESPSNLLEAMIIQQETIGKFTDHELYGNAFTTLLAGEDTTSNSISWTMYYLVQHPELIAKIKAESTSLLGSNGVIEEYEDASKLKWTEACVMEAMRLKPVTPMLYLEALQDATINNLYIKKGTVMFLQNKYPQTQNSNFEDATEFKPERWMSGGQCPFHGNHNPDVMKVFGGGPRYCPGKNLAMIELLMAVSMLCSNFEIRLAVPKEEVKERFSFTMFPENLKLYLQEIEDLTLAK